jgi:HIRAN domain-containing protein
MHERITVEPPFRSPTMTIFLLLVIGVLIWALVANARKSRNKQRSVPNVQLSAAVIHRYEPYADSDESIAEWVRSNPEIDKWFWSKVAGVIHVNRDGTSRQEILKRCESREPLRLVPEPDNPVDRDAIAVLRTNGEQLGYLDRRLAGETHTRMQKGERWEAMLTAVTGRDHPHAWLGANIVLYRLKNRDRPRRKRSQRHSSAE